MKPVVFISGGVCQHVADLNGEPIEYYLIDFDNLEGGDCQICYTTMNSDTNICPGCGFDWSNPSTDEILAALHEMETEDVA